MSFWERRTTGDILVLLVAGTVCLSVLLSLGTITVVKIINPDADTSQAAGIIADIINTLIGLLAGFMAGKTDFSVSRKAEAEDDDETEPLPRRPL